MNRLQPRPNGLASFLLPVPDWIRDYRREWITLDTVAGLTTAAVVVPKAMAYATIAGLPVQVGLYTAFLPMLIYAALGTSRPLSVSTATTLAILAAAALGEIAPGGDPASLSAASATLTLLVGAILVLAALLRLGFVANFISEPVLIGFKAGFGLVIVLDQIPKLLGIHFPKSSFFEDVLAIAKAMPAATLATVAVGAAMIGILVTIERRFPRAPAPLIAVACGIAATSLAEHPEHAALGLAAPGLDEPSPLRDLLRIRSSASAPSTDVLVAVRHRGYWFYIPADDAGSKLTFHLLQTLHRHAARRGHPADHPDPHDPGLEVRLARRSQPLSVSVPAPVGRDRRY
jgi:sulfate permease family protein